MANETFRAVAKSIWYERRFTWRTNRWCEYCCKRRCI